MDHGKHESVKYFGSVLCAWDITSKQCDYCTCLSWTVCTIWQKLAAVLHEVDDISLHPKQLLIISTRHLSIFLKP